MDDLKSKGTKAIFWDLSGKFVTQGMGFAVSIILARLLEPSDFGLIAMIMVIIGVAGVFTDIGLGGALIQRRRVLSIHYSSVFYFNVLAGLLLTIITYYSASWISEFYNNNQLLPLAQVMSISFILSALSSVQITRLRKELNYSLLTKIGIISSLISGAVGISLAFLGAGVWSLVAQALTMGVVYNIYIWTAAKWVPGIEFSWKALSQLWVFGFRMFLSGMLDALFTRLDYLIIGKLFAPATLGFFHRAKSLNSLIIQYSSGSIMTVLFPVLSNVQNDMLRFQNIIMKSLGVICFVVFLIQGVFFLISEELIILLFSDKWLQSADIFKILVLSAFGYPISALLVNVLSSRGNSKSFLRLEIYKKILMVVNFLVLFYYSIHAYLYGLIVISVLGVLLNILFASNEVKLHFYVFIKPIVIQMSFAIIAVILTIGINPTMGHVNIISLITKGTIFIILYLLLNFFMKSSSFEYVVDQITPIIKMKFGCKAEK